MTLTTSPKASLNTSLKTSLSQNSAAVTDAQNSYQQSVLDVSNGMSGIIAAQLPVLNALPANWDSIKTSYINAKSDALSWTNQVYAPLQSTPEEVQSYNDTITALFEDALTQASALIANSANTTAKTLLNADLKNIQKTLSLNNIFIKGTLNAITKFGATTLPDAVAQLQNEVNDAYQDVQLDQAAIDDFKKQIADLKAEITSLGARIGIDSAAIVAELTVGAVFVELGPADLLLIGISVAVTGIDLALDAIQLETDEQKLKSLQAQLKSVEQDAAALQNLGDSYTALAASTSALTSDVNAISSAWQAVEDDITAAINDITQAIGDAAFSDYQAIYNDIAAAETEWNNVYADCSLLYFNVNGNPAQLSISMSSEQVSAALGANPTVDFVTYINNYPSPTAA